ncbi:protein AMN1 homolog [Littorina saxatilis]|uniref:Protein AMN1 homolog n=1 Tax=Littorina saxatilis TaxID=31220 RepID=A0AAN9BPB6_9CAEN
MAASANDDRRVPSLFKTCTKAVVTSLAQHEEDLFVSPMPIKQACLTLMTKRGLVTDDNIVNLLSDKLRVLDLSASEVSDACLFQLSVCRNLCKLDLNSNKACNEAITSAGVSSVSRSCPHLQVLYLRRCINLTDDGVVAVSHNCPQLRELNVGGCPRLTDVSLVALGENSSRLSSFNFSKAAVTDSGVFSLVNGACSASLKEMDMSGCVQLTDEAVEGVVQLCPHIKILVFHSCPLITENARVALENLVHNGATRMKQVTFTVY